MCADQPVAKIGRLSFLPYLRYRVSVWFWLESVDPKAVVGTLRGLVGHPVTHATCDTGVYTVVPNDQDGRSVL